VALLDQLGDLVRQLVRDELAQLAGAAGAGPSYAPLNGLTISPDGSTAYDFDGHIHALGVDIDSDDGSAPAVEEFHSVAWRDVAAGHLIAWLYGQGANHAAFVQLLAAANGVGDGTSPRADIQLFATDPAFDPFNNGTRIKVQASNGGSDYADRLVIASDDSSSFLQVAGATRRLHINVGVDTIVYGAGTAISSALVVNHGLVNPRDGANITPIGVLFGWAPGGTAGAVEQIRCTAKGATTFTCAAVSTVAQAVGATLPIFWLAIG
jgi:hypothetical protein